MNDDFQEMRKLLQEVAAFNPDTLTEGVTKSQAKAKDAIETATLGAPLLKKDGSEVAEKDGISLDGKILWRMAGANYLLVGVKGDVNQISGNTMSMKFTKDELKAIAKWILHS